MNKPGATAAWLVLALLLVGSPAGAAEDELTTEELGLSVEVGFDGRQVPGDMVPVTIEITPTRLFDGVIEVNSTSNTVERIEIEATAGATRRLHVLAPSDSPPRISFIPSDGREPLVVRPRDEQASVALIGIVGAVPAGFPVVDEAVTQRPIVPVAVEPVWLPRGAAALSTLSALVVDAAVLADLPDEARTGLAAAVTAGLDLVVTVAAEDDPALGLPWSPVTELTASRRPGLTAVTPAERARPLADGGDIVGATLLVGEGQVTVLGVAAGAAGLGRDANFWEPLLSAGPQGRTDSVRDGGLASTLGLNLPSVGLLTLFLLAYVLVVGPLTGLTLSRLRRPELAWVVVPGVTLVFSGAAFFLASASQPSIVLVSRTLSWSDGAGTETATLLLRAPRRGGHEIAFDGNWSVRNEAFGSTPVVRRQAGSTTVSLDLEALAVANFSAHRPWAEDPPVTVSATTADDGATVELTITNEGDATFERLMVLAGGLVTMLDDPLPPGSTLTKDVRPTVMPPWQTWMDTGWSLNADHPFRDVLIRGLAGVSPTSGQLHVVAHAPKGLDSAGIRADGGTPEQQGTNVVVSIRPPVDGDVPAWAFDRSVRTTGWIHDGVWVDAPFDEIVQRHRLPNGAARTGTLELVDVDGRFGEFANGFGGGAAGELLCQTVEDRDADGNLVGVTEECLSGPMPVDPEFVCPPEAISCEFDGTTFTICLPDGTCEGGAIAQGPDFGGFGLNTVTAWDWEASSWVPLQRALAAGAAGRFLSPTGELRVRPGELGSEGMLLAFSLRVGT